MPVSTNAGIRPRAASTMIRPVGVGLMSRGPIGVDGLTMTDRQAVARDHRFDQALGGDLAALVGADRVAGFASGADSSAAPPVATACERRDAARVDDPLDAAARAPPPSRRACRRRWCAPIAARLARPQAVIGGHVHDIAHARHRTRERARVADVALDTVSRSQRRRGCSARPRRAYQCAHADIRRRAARARSPSRRIRFRR